MNAERLQKTVFGNLEALGFRPANWLPMPDVSKTLRPASQIAARLMAMEALFTWVSAPPGAVPSSALMNYVARSLLRDWLTPDETKILDLPREEAHNAHVDVIGWRLENMWPLAWILGFEPTPNLQATQIDDKISAALIHDFLPGPDGSIDDLLSRTTPRPTDDVISLEYLFYCAHNAVRSAQLGGSTVPRGFHPVIHGGAVHERRHALTWSLAPGTAWEETDLST